MLQRGQLYRVRLPAGDARRERVFLVVSRDDFLAVRYSTAVCVPVYTASSRSASDLPLGPAEGLKHASFARCDEITSVPRAKLTDYVGALPPEREPELNRALALALAIVPEDIEDL